MATPGTTPTNRPPVRILIAEDDNFYVEHLQRYLAQECYGLTPVEFVRAASVADTIKLAPEADIILLDLYLDCPWEQTLDVLREHAHEWPPVVCITQHAARLYALIRSIQAGAEDFISKERAIENPSALAEKIWLAYARANPDKLDVYAV